MKTVLFSTSSQHMEAEHCRGLFSPALIFKPLEFNKALNEVLQICILSVTRIISNCCRKVVSAVTALPLSIHGEYGGPLQLHGKIIFISSRLSISCRHKERGGNCESHNRHIACCHRPLLSDYEYSPDHLPINYLFHKNIY